MSGEALVLVDTSAWIDGMRRDGPAKAKLADLLRRDRVATCDLVIAELLAGPLAAPEYARVARMLRALHYMDTPSGLGWRAGDLGKRLRGRGLRVPATDLLIAALAEHFGLGIAHCDRHYDLIAREADLRLMRLAGEDTP
jgi:hypothetical protein